MNKQALIRKLARMGIGIKILTPSGIKIGGTEYRYRVEFDGGGFRGFWTLLEIEEFCVGKLKGEIR